MMICVPLTTHRPTPLIVKIWLALACAVMSRHWAITITAIAALAASCASENPPAAQPPQTTGTSTPTSTSSTAPSAVQPAALTGACPLLSNDDLTRLLNNGKDAKLTPTEGAPKDDDGAKIYRCAYNRGSTTALELIAREFPADGRTAATAIDAVSKASKSKPTPVTGVGEAAVFYPTSDSTGVVLAGAKISGGNIRLIALTGPKVLPQDKLTSIATAVMERL
jgi:hypothetical protein